VLPGEQAPAEAPHLTPVLLISTAITRARCVERRARAPPQEANQPRRRERPGGFAENSTITVAVAEIGLGVAVDARPDDVASTP
jgi:hypothetical protein